MDFSDIDPLKMMTKKKIPEREFTRELFHTLCEYRFLMINLIKHFQKKTGEIPKDTAGRQFDFNKCLIYKNPHKHTREGEGLMHA